MKKLNMRNYLGYAAGDLANNLAFSLQALFLLIYYTNVVGLNPAPIATMFLVVRAWDAFADLSAGRLVDLTQVALGKVPAVPTVCLASAVAVECRLV